MKISSDAQFLLRGEEQNREEGEMAQKKLGGGSKCEVNIWGGGRNWLRK